MNPVAAGGAEDCAQVFKLPRMSAEEQVLIARQTLAFVYYRLFGR